MSDFIGDLDTLAATVRRTAQQEALAKEADAHRRAETIVAEAEAEARRLHDEIVTKARARVEEERRQRQAQAALAAQREYLTAREALLDRVWQAAEAHLRALPDTPDYLEILRRLVWHAVGTLGPGRLTLAADPKGHALLTLDRLSGWSQAASDRFGAPVAFERAPNPAPTWGGLVVTHADGRRLVDATFPTRLALARDELRSSISALLVAS
ncbi:MAG TPA: hypothetical protein DEP84_15775 [Chloroflexi bacterium]|nr:hypothetical protein [Chloroflexota bacterium]